jgi:hypothetical protein
MPGAKLSLLLVACGLLLFTTATVVENVSAITSSERTIATFSASDRGFEGPDRLPAGPTTVRLRNQGQEPHQLQLLKLSEGKTPADLAEALRVSGGTMPPWAKHMGGPNGVEAGGTAEATVLLEPGQYVLLCAIPHKKDGSHAVPGPLKPLSVVDSGVTPSDFKGHFHMAMLDYEFVVIEPMGRGEHTFYVVNRGTQAHQVSLVKLEQGSSAYDVLAAFGSRSSPPPQAKLLGGMTGLEPGGVGTFTADLAPGRYAMMCLFPDPASPESHAAKGMVLDFTIE